MSRLAAHLLLSLALFYVHCTPALGQHSTSLGGDLSGRPSNAVVTKLRGRPLGDTAPVSGDYFRFDGAGWDADPGPGPSSAGVSHGPTWNVSACGVTQTITNTSGGADYLVSGARFVVSSNPSPGSETRMRVYGQLWPSNATTIQWGVRLYLNGSFKASFTAANVSPTANTLGNATIWGRLVCTSGGSSGTAVASFLISSGNMVLTVPNDDRHQYLTGIDWTSPTTWELYIRPTSGGSNQGIMPRCVIEESFFNP